MPDRLKRLLLHWFTFWEGALITHFFGLWIALGFCIGWLIAAGGYSLAKSQRFTKWVGDE
jgi:hypothetical protein